MASSWIVLHAGEIIECDKCREVVGMARRHRLVRKYNVPPSMANQMGGIGHAYIILGLLSGIDGVTVTDVCGDHISRLSYTAQVSFWRWPRGWKRPDVRQHLELMALANEPEEKVWRDWQQAIMMTALSGPEGNEKWQQT